MRRATLRWRRGRRRASAIVARRARVQIEGGLGSALFGSLESLASFESFA
jgi:hypothetical protein